MRVCPKDALGRATLVGAALALGSACGGDGPEAGDPRLDGLIFLQQIPHDPAELAFQLHFSDGDGHLAGGFLHVYQQDAETAKRAVAEVFGAQRPPLALTATVGALEVRTRITGNIEAHQRFKIGFMLEDAQGRPSNRPAIELEAQRQ